MKQGIRASTGVVTCQRCGRAVRVRAGGGGGTFQCLYCGGQRAARTHATGRDRTRIEVESGDNSVYGPNYGFE